MKCDELTPIELECNMGKDINGVIHREPWKAYDIDEVDILIDKKDSEIKQLRDECAELHNRVATLLSQIRIRDERIDELKAKLETVNELVKTSKDLYDHAIESIKASHYAEMVDAGMRERRLKRALWLARALRARDIQRWWISATFAPITERACRVWNNVERKCRDKAEEYR